MLPCCLSGLKPPTGHSTAASIQATRLPNLNGAMPLFSLTTHCYSPLPRWQRTVLCSRKLLLIARVCQDEGDDRSPTFILMLIARWLIKKWMLGMLWSQSWRVSLPQRSSLLNSSCTEISKVRRSCLLVSIIATFKKVRMLVKNFLKKIWRARVYIPTNCPDCRFS